MSEPNVLDLLGQFAAEDQAAQQPADESLPGGGFIQRAGASYREKPEDKLSYLASQFGPKNVRLGAENRIEFRPGEQEAWRPFDPGPKSQGVTGFVRDLPNDIVDWTGEAVETVPAMAGAVLGAAGGPAGVVAGLASGALLGNYARQGVAATLPGKESLSPTDRAVMAGNAVSIGLAGEGAGKVIGFVAGKALKAVSRRLFPKNRILYQAATEKLPPDATDIATGTRRTGLDEAMQTETASREVVEDTGRAFDLPLGQKTSSPYALGKERMAAQSPAKAPLLERQAENTYALKEYVGNTIEKTFGGSAVDAKAASETVVKARNALVSKIKAQRAAEAGAEFRAAHAAMKGEPALGMRNTMAAIDEWEKRQLGAGPDTAKFTKEYLSRKRAEILAELGVKWTQVRGGKPVATTEWFQGMMRKWGEAARTGDRVEGIPTDRTVAIARDIMDGLRKDLDAAIDSGGLTAKAAARLQKARDIWAKHSQALEEADSDFMQKLLGMATNEQGELVPTRLMKGTNEQIATVMQILGKTDSTAAQEIQGAVLQDMLEKAMTKAPGSSREAQQLSLAKLATVFGDNEDKLAALLADRPEIVNRIRVFTRLARKASDTGGLAGSQTTPLAQFEAGQGQELVSEAGRTVREFAHAPAATVAGKALTVGMRLANMVISNKKVADLMLDPKALDKMIKLVGSSGKLSDQETGKLLAELGVVGGLSARSNTPNLVTGE